ncbi:complement C3 [Trichonephila clavipes]|nr:complement C3 [Trichonephila clavipes]
MWRRRCFDQVVNLKRNPPVFKSPGKLGTHLSTHCRDQFGATVETAINAPDQLLQKPRGCGEQNMMLLAPTLYTMKYLKIKGKITPEIEDKGFSFIRHGKFTVNKGKSFFSPV